MQLTDDEILLKGQVWKRNDGKELNGLELAKHLTDREFYSTLTVALATLSTYGIDDWIKTGVSAWERIK